MIVKDYHKSHQSAQEVPMRFLDRLVVIKAHSCVQGPRVLFVDHGLQLRDFLLHHLRLREEFWGFLSEELDNLLIQLTNGVFGVFDEEFGSFNLLYALVHLLVDLLQRDATTPGLLLLNIDYSLFAVVSRGHVEVTWLLWDYKSVHARLHFEFKLGFVEILLINIQEGKMFKLLDFKKV